MAKAKSEPKVIRGQSGLTATAFPCSGLVTITISGPKGCGKKLVEKFLEANLPLLPIDEAAIVVAK